MFGVDATLQGGGNETTPGCGGAQQERSTAASVEKGRGRGEDAAGEGGDAVREAGEGAAAAEVFFIDTGPKCRDGAAVGGDAGILASPEAKAHEARSCSEVAAGGAVAEREAVGDGMGGARTGGVEGAHTSRQKTRAGLAGL